MSEKPSGSGLVSVVMPVFNEAGPLAATVEEVAATLGGGPFEIVLVDDGSTDGSWEAIRGLASRVAGLRALRFSRNFGHQAALLAGLAAARGAAVVTMDSDGQHPAEVLPEMLRRWKAGALVVQALRADSNTAGPAKRWTSRLFYRLFSWLAGTRVPPGSADFRLFDRRAVDLALASPRAALFLRGFVPWTGLRTEYLVFTPRPRAGGQSKFSLRTMVGLARQGILRYSVAPLRLSTLLGLATGVFAAGYLVYALIVKLTVPGAAPGWASLVGLIALLGGVQLVVIGILGEYVGMLFQAHLGRPDYVVTDQVEAPTPDPGAANPPAQSADRT